MINLINLVRPN